jgi:heme exporter protein D
MTVPKHTEVGPLSARMRDLATVVLPLLALPVVLQPVLLVLTRLRQDVEPLAIAHELGQALIQITPALLYLWALLAVRRLFSELARQERPFQPALVEGLRRIGWSLAWGAGMDVVGAPMLLRWTDGEPGGSVAHYLPSAVALGVVGLALVLLSRLLQRAAALQDELDQII